MNLRVLLLATSVCAAESEPVTRSTVRLRVEVPPTPAPIEGVPHLVYEVHIANASADTIAIRRLDVLDAGTRRELLAVSGDALAERLGHRVARPSATARERLAPGEEVVIYLEVALPHPAPDTLVHRVAYVAASTGEVEVGEGARVAVGREPPIALSPPLAGGPWAAVHHPTWERGHRRVFYEVDGRARIPGRFAIDWFLLDSAGGLARGDADRVGAWLGYGAEVLAVADAVVAAVRDDMQESATVSANRRHAPADASGNYVVLDLGGGRFAFYEHLRPGSVRVRPGDRVARGQPIAALGFTGSATGPHLHFHVADAASPLGAEGIPFVLCSFERLGAYDSFDAFGKAPWTPSAGGRATRRTNERPAPNVVVRFPDRC